MLVYEWFLSVDKSICALGVEKIVLTPCLFLVPGLTFKMPLLEKQGKERLICSITHIKVTRQAAQAVNFLNYMFFPPI